MNGVTPATGWGAPAFNNGILTLSLTPPWGDAFGDKNPNQYINSKKTYNATELANDKAKLDELVTIRYVSVNVNAQAMPATAS